MRTQRHSPDRQVAAARCYVLLGERAADEPTGRRVTRRRLPAVTGGVMEALAARRRAGLRPEACRQRRPDSVAARPAPSCPERRRPPPHGCDRTPRRACYRARQPREIGKVGAPGTVVGAFIDHHGLAHLRCSKPLARRMLDSVPAEPSRCSCPPPRYARALPACPRPRVIRAGARSSSRPLRVSCGPPVLLRHRHERTRRDFGSSRGGRRASAWAFVAIRSRFRWRTAAMID